MVVQMSRRGFAASLAAAAMLPALPAQAEANAWHSAVMLGQDGRTFTVADLRAPLTLLKLWSYWCPVCWSEMGSLATMAAALGPRNVEVILVGHPEYWSRDQEAVRTRRLPFRVATMAPSNPAAVVRSALMEDSERFAVPRTLLVHGTGAAMTWWRRGAQDWASTATLAALKSSLG